MATSILPKLCSGVSVKIRLNSIETGTTKWKEGTFEILEKDNKVNLCLRFCSGASRTFQLTQNVKAVNQNVGRLMLILKDHCVIILDKMSPSLLQKTRDCLDKLKYGKPILKSSHGSANFSVLGNRSVRNETSPTRERTVSISREDATPRRPLGSPSRAAVTPTRTGLSENRSEKRKRLVNSESDLSEDYPKENDSSSNNKATSDPSRKFLHSCKEKLKQSEENRTSAPGSSTPLQPSSFYGRSVTKDYGQSHSFLDRPSTTTQTTAAKRSLMMPNHSTPFKKVRLSVDYGGWNKQRPSTLAQPQPLLQGFSNLGNTCYMNAILQSLFSLPSFSNDMLRQSIPWKKVPINALLRRFAHLMVKKDVGCPEIKKDLLRKVKSAISSTAERFSGNMQNDAHEFLSQCLDQLKDDIEKMNKNEASTSLSTLSSSCESGHESTTEPGEEADITRIYTCPVAVNMEFEVQHTIVCKGCGEVVTKREQFNNLSIDLPRRKKTLPIRSVQDSLDLFFRMEEIEYSCEKCNGKAATVTHKFSKLPRVLILHLKRYSFNAQLSLNSKLGQQVVIPRYLTLLSHCTESTRPPLGLGWSSQQASVSRTLDTSQTVNSCTSPVRSDPHSFSFLFSFFFLLSLCCSLMTFFCLQRGGAIESAEFNGINDDEMLAAVLEMSRREACHSAPPLLDDDPTSSPDTGFGDTDAHDLAYHADLMENDGKQSADMLDSLDLTMDDNKENQTPEDEAQEMREDDDLKRATELSLQELYNSLPELLCSDDDSGNEDVLDMEYTETEAENLKRNAESGDLPNSFRLISVVSHIGSSSSSGHYISDVYDMKKQSWLTYNDLDVSRTQEAAVQRDRDRSGYIFFYNIATFANMKDPGRNVLQPL
uniref:Ubiquitin carboxyl-terminal hydrolase n=1 Tax=Cynoglossus semilaevis TaxID=244447 RepID=A0A3P8WGD3_CYNSE